MITPKKVSRCEEENLLQIFENGTVIGSIETNLVNNNGSCCGGGGDGDSERAVVHDQLIGSKNNSIMEINDSLNQSESIIIGDCGLDQSCTVQEINENTSMLDRIISANDQNLDNPANDIPVTELLNSSDTCSYDSRNSRRFRRKLKKYRQTEIFSNHFPPPYATIYLDATNTPSVMQAAALNQMRSFDGGHLALSVPVIRRSNAEPVRRGCCFKWFSRPSLPFVIGILALGGVACTLGGIVLGSTGLIEHSTQYLSAALLMIGIGVSLLVISGAIWRLSIPDETDTCPCFRTNLETCRNCNSPYCQNRLVTGGYLYPEFQHRPPPPSYLTSLHECTVRVLLREPPPLEPTTLAGNTQQDTSRTTSPPPSYRSYSASSLSVVVPIQSNNEIQSVVELATGTCDDSLVNVADNLFCSPKDVSTS